MITFEKLQEKVRGTNQKLVILRKREKKLQDALNMYLRLIFETCQPVCFDAVIAFNTGTVSLSIPYASIKLSFDADQGLIDMAITLKYRDGTWPQGELDEHWVAELTTRIRTHIDAGFEKAGIPFRFGKLIIPAGYFEK